MDIDISDILTSVSHTPALAPETQDLHDLTRAWIAERSAPELLPWPGPLMERVMARLARQIANIEDETGAMDPRSNFRLVVLQTDVERLRFLVRGLVRARVGKIDHFPLHYVAQTGLLSPSEAQYLSAHTALLHRHYAASFLGSFPAALRRMDDTAGGISMVEKPDEDAAVFVRVFSDDVGLVEVPGTDVKCDMQRNDVWCVRWSAVRDLVADGLCELV